MPDYDPYEIPLPRPLAFVDTETTGLDRTGRHQIWEAALVVRRWKHDANGFPQPTDEASHWFLPVDLGRADPIALRIGRFHERHPKGYDYKPSGPFSKGVTPLDMFAEDFADRTRGCHLIGAVTSFDEERLWRLLTENGACPEWHYHLICVENVVYGWLLGRNRKQMDLPWDSQALTRATGIDPDLYDKHTAMGDVEWAIAAWDKVHERSLSDEVMSNQTRGGERLTWKQVAEEERMKREEGDRFKKMVTDLSRCPHGRHEGDLCSGASGCDGPSKGNPHLKEGDVIGYGIGALPYTVPSPLELGKIDRWGGGQR